ncbi:MAG: NADH-quinone oxidoreductase subunit J [Bdellovibrionales bacterium]|nr:NADH-quinone oxidoreductase subunit J [Bdellovibrionales bacterium]
MSLTFCILGAIIFASACGVVLMRNPIHSALCLIVNLVAVAGIFAQLQAHFLAVVQIIVYAGAIMVLVVFVIMLLNAKEEETSISTWLLSLFALVGGVVFVEMVFPLLRESFPVSASAKNPVVGTVEAIGQVLYTKYLFPFEAASLLILIGVVGALMLAKSEKRSQG